MTIGKKLYLNFGAVLAMVVVLVPGQPGRGAARAQRQGRGLAGDARWRRPPTRSDFR